MINEELLNIYGCPICKKRLYWDKVNRKLICYPCQKTYHITKSDVPVLLSNQQEYEKKYNKNYDV